MQANEIPIIRDLCADGKHIKDVF